MTLPPSYSDYGRRIAADGIRARGTRGEIGESWWSRRFITVLTSFGSSGRLTRGRTYARQGQVLTLTIAPGLVSARVQGSRPRPYDVQIGLTPFSPAIWTGIEAELAGQALFSARLLAGEMPAEIEPLCAQAGVALFPARWGDLRQSCSCPDGVVPCKHIAATFYLLAERFDDDPFEILHWRGRPREELLANLRALRGSASPDASPDADADPGVAEPGLFDDLPSPDLAETLDRFWVAPVPLPTRPPTLPTRPDLLLRLAATPPVAIGGTELGQRLRSLYNAL